MTWLQYFNLSSFKVWCAIGNLKPLFFVYLNYVLENKQHNDVLRVKSQRNINVSARKRDNEREKKKTGYCSKDNQT